MNFEEDLKFVISKYQKLLFAVSLDITHNKEESENIVQDSFLSYYKHKEEYSILDETSKKRILARIAINKSKDYLKNSYVKKRNDGEDEIENKISDVDLEESLIKKEKEERIRKAVLKLKEPYKSLITNYYFDDFNLDELSKKTNSTKSTVKVQLTRAKEKLKLILGGEADE